MPSVQSQSRLRTRRVHVVVLYLVAVLILGLTTPTFSFSSSLYGPYPRCCHSSTSMMPRQQQRALHILMNTPRHHKRRAYVPLFSTEESRTSDINTSAQQGEEEEEPADWEFLKQELEEYIAKRKEMEQESGETNKNNTDTDRVIGGSKGNKLLEFVSAIPSKERVIQETFHLFDYDQLTKYGYGHLVTPIMKAGGRNRMYKLMKIEAPPTAPLKSVVTVSTDPLMNTNASSTSTYSGLQLGLLYNDDAQAAALERIQEKKKLGAPSTSTVPQEIKSYRQPFADKRNVGPLQTPDWTPERLDEYAKQQGKAQAWARAAREGAFVKDPQENWNVDTAQRFFSILTAGLNAVGFGKATGALWPTDEMAILFLHGIQAVAVLLLATSTGCAVVSSQQATERNRDALLWTVKGWLGGPFTLQTIKGLPSLRTEKETLDDASSKNMQGKRN